MPPIVKFGFNGVAGTPGAPRIFPIRIFGQMITALNHESFHDPMESSAVIVPLLCQGLKILDRFGCHLRPEFNHEFTSGSFEHRELFCWSCHKESRAISLNRPERF